MTIKAPFNPSYTRGITVTPAAASANSEIATDSKQICMTNLGANVCYIRIGDSATMAATTADYPIPSGAQLVVTRDPSQTRIAYISAAGTTLHILPGEGF